jgi:glucuronokinase
MLTIRKKAFARAGLVGNPSDGYNGQTISVIVRNLHALVVLYEWEDVELISCADDQSRFGSVRDLARDVRLHGYYGGIRLIKATIKKFVEYCDRVSAKLHERNFSIRYSSTIPRQVGLAGSSAIIVATLRCLMEFYDVAISQAVQASLALAVETEELGIAAGLQDRVVQVYEGLVFMDFRREHFHIQDGYGCGAYEALDPAVLPPLYIAYKEDVSEPTEVFHNDIRGRYQRGDQTVIDAMDHFAALASKARTALLARDHDQFAQLVNANFDMRRSIYRLPEAQVQLVETARSTGASAKFAGSGGAIVGSYHDAAMFQRLEEALKEIGCVVFQPFISERTSP